jgi:O-acetyl-ADP-ribose deacetylase (regulator of RNase III)
MEKIFDNRIKVITGDITTLEVEGVVNAANSSLMGGGGVDGAIHRKGGPEILKECKEIRKHQYPDGLPTGKAVVTGGGKLPAQHVIHTVGPVWHGGKEGEKEELEKAYQNSLLMAEEMGMKTLAFPAISTGIYGYPPELAAVTAFKTVKSHLEKKSIPREVYLVFFSEGDKEQFLKAIQSLL